MSDDGTSVDAGFDDWLDALADGDPYYLECANGHGSLPPQRVCPECGSTELTDRPLPASGEVETVSVVHVPTPAFADDAPYATAIADFGPVRLTGQVTGVDPAAVEAGLDVSPDVDVSETTGDRVIVFRVQ